MTIALQKNVEAAAVPVAPSATIVPLSPPRASFVQARLIPAAKEWAATLIPPIITIGALLIALADPLHEARRNACRRRRVSGPTQRI